MYNLSLIEDSYKKYIKNLENWIPEGIYHIDLSLLHYFDLLHYHKLEHQDSLFLDSFQAIEFPEKMTLVNDHFVIWIQTEYLDNSPVTYVLIALNQEKKAPELQLAFVASGVYNTSKIIMGVLEKFIQEIKENEDILKQYGEAS